MITYSTKNKHEIFEGLDEIYKNYMISNIMLEIIKNMYDVELASNNNNFKNLDVAGKERFFEKQIASKIAVALGVPAAESFIYKRYCENVVELSKIQYLRENPYVRDIQCFDDSVKSSNLVLSVKNQLSYRLEILKEPYYSPKLIKKYSCTFFEEEYKYLCLSENNRAWMSIRPSEMETQKEYIEKLTGDVLIFGLGLGYAAYLTALKEDVKSVTIVEKNKEIIDIFKKHILPQFKTDTKVIIIEDDAHNLFKDVEKMNSYDSCFIDIWFGVDDGLSHYLYFKNNENSIKYNIGYWMEQSIRDFLKEIMLIVMVSSLSLVIQSYTKIYAHKAIKLLEEKYPQTLPFLQATKQYLGRNDIVIDINQSSDIFEKFINDDVLNILCKLAIK